MLITDSFNQQLKKLKQVEERNTLVKERQPIGQMITPALQDLFQFPFASPVPTSLNLQSLIMELQLQKSYKLRTKRKEDKVRGPSCLCLPPPIDDTNNSNTMDGTYGLHSTMV